VNSFNARATFQAGNRTFEFYRLDALNQAGIDVHKLPYSIRILLENLLRNENGTTVRAGEIEALARWSPRAAADREIAFTPARVLLQDFTGVPAVVDLAAMRDAMAAMGGDPRRINPVQPVELVIDHSVQVDYFGSSDALRKNAEIEFERNQERYVFLKWGQKAFKNFKVVPPDMGIVHQVNLEYLARVVFSSEETGQKGESGRPIAYPDTLVGTDSHTTMINGLGVLGWGVGGIEAEAAMLGQPVSMLIPHVVGFRLEGALREGATATDLVLTVTQMLRAHGVVGKFVEFYGPGLAALPLADRATIGNMSPEYGATCGIFPVDAETLRYLRLTGRPEEAVTLVEAYMKEQGLFHDASQPEAVYSETLSLDLASVEPSMAGPKRPQDRVPLSNAKGDFERSLQGMLPKGAPNLLRQVNRWEGEGGNPTAVGVLEDQYSKTPNGHAGPEPLDHGAIVIAAITSCTNTSNPSVLIGAGLLARKAAERGLQSKPWVKTSLAPGSRVVTEYLKKAGLDRDLEKLGFHTVGYGCTTCIGNSGPLPPEISEQIDRENLVVCSVLSGNRNFEGRINSEVKANYLMSPPLVVAYAIAGRMDIDLYHEPLGTGSDGTPVYLKEIWPTQQEIQEMIGRSVSADLFRKNYAAVYEGDEQWNALKIPEGDLYSWPESTYVKLPPYFDKMPKEAPETVNDIHGARVLALLGDSITTDHISPAGSIKLKSPAGEYLVQHGVTDPLKFNSYGSRRGNHEVMVRGTFANVRLRNQLAPETEGGFTTYLPATEVMTIFAASERYQAEGTPLIILAGKEYGSGSSRDWAAKGPNLLGVKVVIAESYERIHRSNLLGMGVLPLQFAAGESAASLKLTGGEVFEIVGLSEGVANSFANGRTVKVKAAGENGGAVIEFDATVRIDTDQELLYYRNGGILQYVLRQLLANADGS